MSYTKSTPNYHLPQYVGTDKPSFLGDFNSAMRTIDEALEANKSAGAQSAGQLTQAQALLTETQHRADDAKTEAEAVKKSIETAESNAASATAAADTASSTATKASTDAIAAKQAADAAKTAAETAKNTADGTESSLNELEQRVEALENQGRTGVLYFYNSHSHGFGGTSSRDTECIPFDKLTSRPKKFKFYAAMQDGTTSFSAQNQVQFLYKFATIDNPSAGLWDTFGSSDNSGFTKIASEELDYNNVVIDVPNDGSNILILQFLWGDKGSGNIHFIDAVALGSEEEISGITFNAVAG